MSYFIVHFYIVFVAVNDVAVAPEYIQECKISQVHFQRSRQAGRLPKCMVTNVQLESHY
jgi:hypothetical protein